MKCWLQFVTVPTADTPGTALILHFDHKRYLIGRIGEGLQRSCVENGIPLRKVEDMLITGRCDTESIGGTIGMFLTLADVVLTARAMENSAGNKAAKAIDARAAEIRRIDGDVLHEKQDEDLFLTMYGPPNLTHSIATARRFVFRKGLPIRVHEVRAKEPSRNEQGRWLPDWADGNIRVWAMAIKPAGNQQSGQFTTHKTHMGTLDDAKGTMVESTQSATEESDAEREDRHDQLRRGVVADMFSSNWRMDALVETPLNEVQLPAKLWIRDPRTKAMWRYTGPLPGGGDPLPTPIPKVLVRKPWPGALVASLPPTTPRDEAISYIIGNYPRRGKFDSAVADALGVAKSDRAALTKGRSVQGANGRTITPEMVIGADIQSAGVAVVDLPSDDYVEPLVNRAEWMSEDVMLGIEGIVWILGPNVAANPLLRAFMERTSHLKHTVSSPDHCPNSIAMDAAAKSSIRLAQIDKEHYPIPHFDNTVLPQPSFRTFNDAVQPLPESVTIARRGMTLQLVPKFEIQTKSIPPPLQSSSSAAEEEEDIMLNEAIEIAKSAHESSSKPEALKKLHEWNSQLPLQDAEIIALGTGSSVPSRYRNVSATLVRVPGYGSYLLDAGENTLGQLQRVFPPAEMVDVLKDLRMIWISHLHADHHLGTVSVIKAWHSVVHGLNSTVAPTSPDILHSLTHNAEPTSADQRPKYLAVVSDIAMLHYLSEYASVENYGYEHVLPLSVSAEWDHSAGPARNSTILRLVHRDCPVQEINSDYYPALLGLRNLQAVPVNHCHGALAVAMTFPKKWTPTPQNSNLEGSKYVPPFKIAYSGDCRPSARFAAIGERATVLIHEATFEDELVGDAKAKKHSTIREALGVGSLMGAKCVVLTHFSQRYQKIPILDHFWGEPDAVTKEILGEDDEQEKQAGIEPTEDDVRLVGGNGAPPTAPMNTNFESGVELPSPTSTEVRLASPIRETLSPFQQELARSKPVKQGDMKVIVAFDYMRVRVGDMARMEALRPALAKLFDVDMEENEKRAAKRVANAGNGNGANGGKKGKKRKSATASFQERAVF